MSQFTNDPNQIGPWPPNHLPGIFLYAPTYTASAAQCVTGPAGSILIPGGTVTGTPAVGNTVQGGGIIPGTLISQILSNGSLLLNQVQGISNNGAAFALSAGANLLPVIGNLKSGTEAYCSDLGGPAVWNSVSNTWTPVGAAAGVFPVAGLSTAVSSASANSSVLANVAAVMLAFGGGIGLLPAQAIPISQSIPLYSGVGWKGQGYSLNGALAGGPQLSFLNGGTVVKPQGAYPAFAGNATDLGSPLGTALLMFASIISGCSVQDLGIDCTAGGTYGIKVGAAYQAGAQYPIFRNLFIQNATNWGFYGENLYVYNLEDIAASGCGNGIMVTASGTTNWNFGNGHLSGCRAWGSTANGSGRGIAIQARLASTQNDVNLFDITITGNAVTSTQAATMANTSTAIGVTDLSKFGVGMPVVFSATVNGFTTGVIYFVTSVAGASGAGNITVANAMSSNGGAPANIAATGNTAVNIITQGWALLEVGGADTTSSVSGSAITGACDVEVGGTARVVVQNPFVFKMELGQGGPSTYCDVCVRNNQSPMTWIHCPIGSNKIDLDAASQRVMITGTLGAFTQQSGVGFVNNSANAGNMEISLVGSQRDIYADTNFFNNIRFNRMVAFQQTTQASAGTVGYFSGNSVVFTTGAGGTLNFPTLTTAGIPWEVTIINPNNAAVVITGGGSQNFIGKGVAPATSRTLPAYTTERYIGSNNGGTLFWGFH